MIARPEVMEIYWRFTSERQKVFERRLAGQEEPWTDDEIIQQYKFCNVYRAADRVSQYLIRDIAYPLDDSTPEDILFRIVAFRIFSKIETWESVKEYLGKQPTLENLADNTFEEALRQAKTGGRRLYTGAFILAPADYGDHRKYVNHVKLLQHMFLKEDMADYIQTATYLKMVFDELKSYAGIGDFLAYQIAIDLNYSGFMNFSENDFVRPGPGAVRGVRKTFFHIDKPIEDVIMYMVENQERYFEKYELEFNGLFGRPLHAIDCQNLFCEVDKYCRVAIPDLASARTRIKANFKPNPDPVQLFFPPKWNINKNIESFVAGASS